MGREINLVFATISHKLFHLLEEKKFQVEARCVREKEYGRQITFKFG
jgi:hypothetical protein